AVIAALFLPLIAAARGDGKLVSLLRRGAFVLAPSLAVTGLVYLGYRIGRVSAILGDNRGGLDLDPSHLWTRTLGTFGRAQWTTISRDWGMPILTAAFRDGVSRILHSGVGVGLVVCALAGLLVLIVRPPASRGRVPWAA